VRFLWLTAVRAGSDYFASTRHGLIPSLVLSLLEKSLKKSLKFVKRLPWGRVGPIPGMVGSFPKGVVLIPVMVGSIPTYPDRRPVAGFGEAPVRKRPDHDLQRRSCQARRGRLSTGGPCQRVDGGKDRRAKVQPLPSSLERFRILRSRTSVLFGKSRSGHQIFHQSLINGTHHDVLDKTGLASDGIAHEEKV
jgi:hypothetical protein